MIFDSFAGFSGSFVESFSELSVDVLALLANISTVGFEKIGSEGSATRIGVGLNSGLLEDFVSLSQGTGMFSQSRSFFRCSSVQSIGSNSLIFSSGSFIVRLPHR